MHESRMIQERKPYITTCRIQDGKLAAHSVSESALALAHPRLVLEFAPQQASGVVRHPAQPLLQSILL